jgi:signal transduction histidine kinase
MKTMNIEQLNSMIQTLTDTSPDKLLSAKIVETGELLTGAYCGKLFLYKKDHLKKTYYSDSKVKLNVLVTQKNFNKLLLSKEIFLINDEQLFRWKIKRLPGEIKSVVVVPFLYTRQPLGFLFLYFTKEKKQLTVTEKEVVTLFSHIAALALTKAKLQEESQRALELRDRFISLASHELRTPLTSIHGYIQLLYTRMQERKTLESRWIRELFIESVRMTQLVKELLDVNRIKQGQFAFVFSEVPFQEIVERAIERHRLTSANHPFIFQSRLTNRQSVIVGDFDKLVEMVSSLLENAVKFSLPGEKITITLKKKDNTIIVAVKDNGKGISRKDLAAIFNGFYKPEDASHIEGIGVGLLLARHIVEKHRGKLHIKSQIDKGTTVTVRLPSIKTIQ